MSHALLTKLAGDRHDILQAIGEACRQSAIAGGTSSTGGGIFITLANATPLGIVTNAEGVELRRSTITFTFDAPVTLAGDLLIADNAAASTAIDIWAELINSAVLDGRVSYNRLANHAIVSDLSGVPRLQLTNAAGWEVLAATRGQTKAIAACAFTEHWERQLDHVLDLIRISELGFQCLTPEAAVSNPDDLWILLGTKVETTEANLPLGFRLIPSLGSWPVASLSTLTNHLGQDRANELIRRDIPNFTTDGSMEVRAFKASEVNLRINGRSASPHYFCYAALAARDELAEYSIQQEASTRPISL